MKKSRPTEEERFWSKVNKDTPTGCWLWTACKNKKGYGEFKSCKSRGMSRAHRWLYEKLNGPIPKGMQLDHFKRNNPETRDQCFTNCVNPEHLELVTSKENSMRSKFLIESTRKNGINNRKDNLPKGIYKSLNKFRVRLWIKRKAVEVGTFFTLEEAVDALHIAEHNRKNYEY